MYLLIYKNENMDTQKYVATSAIIEKDSVNYLKKCIQYWSVITIILDCFPCTKTSKWPFYKFWLTPNSFGKN